MHKRATSIVALAGLILGTSSLSALAVEDQVQFEEQTVFTTHDSTLQAWANEKTQSNSAKPYIAALHPTPGGTATEGQQYGLFGEGFESTDTSDGTDGKIGMLTFDLSNLENAPNSAVLELTYIGHIRSADKSAHVGVALVDTEQCTNSATTCTTDIATWATRPKFALEESDVVFADEFDANVAGTYTGDSMTVPADKRRTVTMDVKSLVDSAFESDKKVLTFVVGETNGAELRFASSEGASGVLGGLQASDAPKLKVTVPQEPEAPAPTGPRAWDDKVAEMTGHDVLWYKQSALNTPKGNVGTGNWVTGEHDNWQRATLPIGNGKVGGTVWGEVASERVTFNEETLWTGGPAEGREYNGGNAADRGRHGETLRELNQELADGKFQVSNPGGLTGGFNGAHQGSYQNWGEIRIDTSMPANANVYLYERSLDLTNGIASVHYNYKNTDFMREYFVSNPDDVMVLRFDAQGDQKLSFDVSLPLNAQYTRTDESVEVSGNTLVSAGALANNGLRYNAQITADVTGAGASVTGADDALRIESAESVTLFVAAATDYEQSYPTYRTGETVQALQDRVARVVSAAVDKGYEGVRADHVSDHADLYSRVSVDLGQADTYGVGAIPTNELLDAYKAGTADAAQQRALEMLVYNYGRYLTIGSSREDSQLPSNLQGIWSSLSSDNAHGSTPWGSDFHMNVNLQMNYWPTYSSNLAGSALPLIEFTEGLVKPGRITADVYAGAATDPNAPIGEGAGYMAHTENTAYGWTTPGAAFSWGWSPAAVPWLLQNVYEYYEYTGDEAMLRDRIYPLLKEEANFYVNYMLHKGNRPASDGEPRLTTGVAYSPEHGPQGTDGNTYESSLVWQLLNDAIESAEVLEIDAELRDGAGECSVDNWEKSSAGEFTLPSANRSWTCALSLLKPIEVGDSGQIKEWFFEGELGKTDTGEAIPAYQGGHRHLSHMLGLFPGDLITVDNPQYMDAAKKSLNARGDDATGWGVGQRINSWARTGDGDRALVLIQKQLNKAIYPNLFDAHPPFQIDGNFGNTAGVNEMLMQSNSTFKTGEDEYANYIHLLPALPAAWADGSADGLVARGNFVLDFSWKDGQVTDVTVHSRRGGEAVLAFEGAARFKSISENEGVAVTALDQEHLKFSTEAGGSYTLSMTELAPVEPEPEPGPVEPGEPGEPGPVDPEPEPEPEPGPVEPGEPGPVEPEPEPGPVEPGESGPVETDPSATEPTSEEPAQPTSGSTVNPSADSTTGSADATTGQVDKAPSGGLAKTGVSVAVYAIVALVLLFMGGALVARRQRDLGNRVK
ncbi:MAG: glycoside hydrolase N-terminal domain-containing protein [Actinomycetaceae bacterium]|nr:glycoside hydrolase N-terminal domain-containing protein [Actinomycetaceae bacterium]